MSQWPDDALGTLADRGATHLEIWCVHLPCLSWTTISIAELLKKHDPNTLLVMIARKARCRVCGHKGAHIQPARPGSPGTPHYDPEARDPWTGLPIHRGGAAPLKAVASANKS